MAAMATTAVVGRLVSISGTEADEVLLLACFSPRWERAPLRFCHKAAIHQESGSESSVKLAVTSTKEAAEGYTVISQEESGSHCRHTSHSPNGDVQVMMQADALTSPTSGFNQGEVRYRM